MDAMSFQQSGYSFSFLDAWDVTDQVTREINSLFGLLTERTNARVTQESLKFELTFQTQMRMIVAQHESAIVGMGVVCKVPRLTCNECEIHDIVVDPRHQGKGIGKEILSRLMWSARKIYRADHINLTSRPDRVAANRLYQALGFTLRETNCYRLTF